MEIKARVFDPVTLKVDCLVLVLPPSEDFSDVASPVNRATNGVIASAIKDGELAKSGDSLTLYATAGLACRRLVLISCGDKPLSETQFDKLLGKIANAVTGTGIKTAALCLNGVSPQDKDSGWAAAQLAKVLGEQAYIFDQYKSKKDTPAPALKKLTLHSLGSKVTGDLNTAITRGTALARGINFARELGDLPPNVCNPTYLAKRARELAKNQPKLTAKILSEKQMRDLKMGSLLSVTAGAETPAQMIILEYKGAPRSNAPIALVGKGVTFDSGGISLKPGAGMDEMKYDMCGAASVFGAMVSAAELDLPVNIVGIIPAVENMPSGNATRPGDIVTSMSGQTIEILNTDAEGRLILCDALTYVGRYKPKAVVDIATLTGACVVALGNHATGLFSNNDELATALLRSGEAAGDRAWRMPIWEEYDQQLKSNFADMANVGGRNAGSVTAACFLARFTRDYTWAHLDIAGTAWKSGGNKGATGRPVPLLVEYLSSQAG
ncbi:MAG: leucyl aminopeptidase [Porticoccaceae bacterium]|nr:leucyl aminopeptidase [Porticoccaceae bacterium]